MKKTLFKVENRVIDNIDKTNFTGLLNVDKLEFIFNEEWDDLDKTLVIILGETTLNLAMINDSVVLPPDIYDAEECQIGIFGTKVENGEAKKILTTMPYILPICEGMYKEGEEPSNLPTPTQWDLYITEINGLLEDCKATKEQCDDILTTIISIKEDIDSTKTHIDEQKQAVDTTVSNFNVDYAQKKSVIDGEISDFNSSYATKVADFNSNASQKTSDFNSNATSKTNTFNENYNTKKGTIDTKVNDFNTDYAQKVTDFNSNASSKTTEYNTNHTTKMNAYNDNHDDKMGAYNSNATQKTSDFNDNASAKTTAFNNNYDEKLTAINTAGTTQVGAVESAGTTQVGNVNTAGTTQVSAVNQAGQQKIDEINSNQTVQKVADHEIRITRLEKARHIYGVKRARNNNSSSEWERTDDAIGLVANAQIGQVAVKNSFDNIAPWCNIIRKNVDVENDRVTAYYGETGFKLDGSNGDVFTEYPDIYFKVWQDEDYDYAQIADGPMEGFTKVKSFDFTSYDVGYENGRMRSYSGMLSGRGTSIVNQRTRAKALGSNYALMDWRYFVVQLLYLVEYADYNSQAVLGAGLTGLRSNKNDKALVAEESTNRIIVSNTVASYFIVGQTIAIGTSNVDNFSVASERRITAINDYDDGTTTGKEIVFDGNAVNISVGNVIWSCQQYSGGGDFLGMKSGCLVNDGKHAVNYRGLENPFGNQFDFVDGINVHNGQVYICYDPSEYVSNKITEPYVPIGYVNAYSGNDSYNGYAKTLGFDENNPLFRFPIELGGSSSTYMCDNYYISTGDRVARVGGTVYSGANAGLWCCSLSGTSWNSSWDCGARVLRYQT